MTMTRETRPEIRCRIPPSRRPGHFGGPSAGVGADYSTVITGCQVPEVTSSMEWRMMRSGWIGIPRDYDIGVSEMNGKGKKSGQAYLDEVEASTGDTPHEGLQGDPTIIAIDGNFVSQSRIPGPLIITHISASLLSHIVNKTYDDPHVEVSPAVGVQRPRAVGLVTRNADVVESLRKADAGPVGTLGLELQGHEAAEAVQEGSRGAGPVVGGGTTETARSPARKWSSCWCIRDHRSNHLRRLTG
jgi:acyl dehydratase